MRNQQLQANPDIWNYIGKLPIILPKLRYNILACSGIRIQRLMKSVTPFTRCRIIIPKRSCGDSNISIMISLTTVPRKKPSERSSKGIQWREDKMCSLMDYFKDRFNKDFTCKMKILIQKVKAEK